MTILIILICLILIGVIVVQIGRVAELSKRIRGEEQAQYRVNNTSGWLFLIFLVVFLLGTTISAYMYKDNMLGYGPWVSASEHGVQLDTLFNTTLIFTGIIFVLTHILLFYYAWKYRALPGKKAKYVSHNDTLELVWTAIPAVVMAFLVIRGLDAWNETMADVQEGEDYIEVEATGYQFAWILRYPGLDDKLGTRDYKLIDPGLNPLGQDWNDVKNIDDFQSNKLVLPKGKKIRVRITARDVLHNFDLPHFRVKMDAIPGIPTYFTFTPRFTTVEYQQRLGALDANGDPIYPEWHEPDPDNPEMKRYETFRFELACAELCGRGHYSMQKEVEIVEPEAYEAWVNEQPSWYMQSIRFSEDDPFKDTYLPEEVESHRQELLTAIDSAQVKEDITKRNVALNYIHFQTGSADLKRMSTYQLDDLIKVMQENPAMEIIVEGHTDDTGSVEVNTSLSENRAQAVVNYLVRKGGVDTERLSFTGFGSSQPIADNDTEDGRAQNRRVEFRIK